MEKVITSQTWYQQCEEFPELLESWHHVLPNDLVRTGFKPYNAGENWCVILFSDEMINRDFDYKIFLYCFDYDFVFQRAYFVNLESKSIYLATEDSDNGGMMVKKLDQIISPHAEEKLNNFLINLDREPFSARPRERKCPYCRTILEHKRDDGLSWLFCEKCFFSSRRTKHDPFNEFDAMIWHCQFK